MEDDNNQYIFGFSSQGEYDKPTEITGMSLREWVEAFGEPTNEAEGYAHHEVEKALKNPDGKRIWFYRVEPSKNVLDTERFEIQ